MLVFLILSLSFMQTCYAFPFLFFKPDNTPMLDMLDMMQQLMTGGTHFDRNFIKEIRTCMASFDPQLPNVHDKLWQGIIDYWVMGGNPDDPWGKTRSKFAECNITESSYKKMTIFEPCNFASNVAYYHLLIELCNRRANGSVYHMRREYITALGKIMAAQPVTSSFLHLSNTKLGSQQDIRIGDIMAYTLLQGIMESLPNRSPILTDLSPISRPMTSLQIVAAIQNIYFSEPVTKWYNTFESLDIPSYLFSFAGIILTVLHMNFNDKFVDQLFPIIVDSFGIAAEDHEFLSKDFLPELRRATPLPDRKKNLRNNLLGNTVSSVAKLNFAYVWNEVNVITDPILLEPIPNRIGTALLPIVNKILNVASNFQHFQPNFQRGANIYPGEQWCNPKYAHAKWHVQSALALLDLLYLGDEMNRLLTPTRS